VLIAAEFNQFKFVFRSFYFDTNY